MIHCLEHFDFECMASATRAHTNADISPPTELSFMRRELRTSISGLAHENRFAFFGETSVSLGHLDSYSKIETARSPRMTAEA